MTSALSMLRHAWRTLHAKRDPVGYARKIGVRVGERVRIFSLHPGAFGSEPYLITIEDDAVITANVRFITHDGSTFIFRNDYPDLDVMGPICVGANSFIGSGTVVLPGVKIGRNCVVGAMSVVTRSLPDDSVAVGSPAKVISSRQEFLSSLLLKNAGTGELSELEKRRVLLSMESRLDDQGRLWLVRCSKET